VRPVALLVPQRLALVLLHNHVAQIHNLLLRPERVGNTSSKRGESQIHSLLLRPERVATQAAKEGRVRFTVVGFQRGRSISKQDSHFLNRNWDTLIQVTSISFCALRGWQKERGESGQFTFSSKP
jgi:hypothetical protein